MGFVKSKEEMAFYEVPQVEFYDAEMVIEAIKASSLELVGVCDKIVQDARLDLINEGAALYRKCGADCMVSIGGAASWTRPRPPTS